MKGSFYLGQLLLVFSNNQQEELWSNQEERVKEMQGHGVHRNKILDSKFIKYLKYTS